MTMIQTEHATFFHAFHPVLLVLGLCLGFAILQIVYRVTLHPLANVPGPRAWSVSRLPFVRALLKGTIVHDFQRLHAEYGPVLRIAPNEVTFAHEQAWADIFHAGPGRAQFLKDPIWWGRQSGQPASLINAIDPTEHAQIRNRLAPGFTPKALRSQEQRLIKYVDLLIEKLSDACKTEQRQAAPSNDFVSVDVIPWFHFLTFDIFGDLGFGESFDCLQTSKYHPWIALLFNSVRAASVFAAIKYYPFLRMLLEKCIPPSLKKMKSQHFQQIADKVDRRLSLNKEDEEPDIMSYVVGGDQDITGCLPISVIYATFAVLTTAGSETTATALSGIVNYLVQNPRKLQTLATEIRSHFKSNQDITLDGLRNLTYLNAVINEGLRLCPPIPWVLPRRVPPGGGTVCGIWLPGGTAVSIQAYTLNRSSSHFHAASSFLPERWLPDALTNSSSPFFDDRRQSIQSFGTGPRNCMGRHLAWAELRLTLSKLLWNFEMQQAPGRPVQWEELRTFLLVEKKQMPIDMKVRD